MSGDNPLSKTTPPVQSPVHTEALIYSLEVSDVLDRISRHGVFVDAHQTWFFVCDGKLPSFRHQTPVARPLRWDDRRGLVLVAF